MRDGLAAGCRSFASRSFLVKRPSSLSRPGDYFSLALEQALKLYNLISSCRGLHCQGAEEGPIALIDERVPVITAVVRGTEVDKPRNVAKWVTVK